MASLGFGEHKAPWSGWGLCGKLCMTIFVAAHHFSSDFHGHTRPAWALSRLHLLQMSQLLVKQISSKVFGQRTQRHVWSKIISGEMPPHEVAKFAETWYYLPDLRSMRDPLYFDSKEKTNRARTERLKRRGKGPPTKGAGKRASRR